MEFFNSAVDVLQTLVIALGAGLGIWGGINLMEVYGNDNPCLLYTSCGPMKDRGLTLSRQSTWEPPCLLWNARALKPISEISTEILKPLTA